MYKRQLDDTYVVFEIETTGFSAVEDHIIEIGAVKVENGKITDKYSTCLLYTSPSAKGIWAPCLTYCEEEDMFYVCLLYTS